jgi:hypothetical protein
LAGRPPTLSGAIFSAKDAQIAGDFRSLELTDARVLLEGPVPVNVHVGAIALRGLAPWSHASTLPWMLRALLLALAGAASASLATFAVLRGAVRSRFGSIALGAVGPLAALGLLRLLERLDVGAALYGLVPAAGGAAIALAALLPSRLPVGRAKAKTTPT